MKKFFITLILIVICSYAFSQRENIKADSLFYEHSEMFIDNVKVGEYPQLFENEYIVEINKRNLRFQELIYDDNGKPTYGIIYLFCYSQNWGSKGQIFRATYRLK